MKCDDCGRECFRKPDGRIDYADAMVILIDEPPKETLMDYFDKSKQMKVVGNICWQCNVDRKERRLLEAAAQYE